ncbi:ABC transporter permease [Acuticoccus sediminis]|uniref:ABC transporter permease n=1 Tax=Acuticoccus sediminis TaxID=2184697 RepID=UPI001CFE4C9F|nr:ABC transporter permease [Acuticoccus sediminis]
MKRAIDTLTFGLVALLMVTTAAVILIPLGYAIVMSFEPRQYMGGFPPPGLSLRWYQSFFQSPYYMNGLRTSLILALSASIISATLGLLAALAIAMSNLPGRSALAALLLSPLIVPGVVVGFSLLMFFAALGLNGSPVTLLIAHVLLTLPYTIRTSLAAVNGISPRLYDAALSLGATEGQALRKVIVPLARTGIATGFVFAFCFSLDDIAVTIFLTSPSTTTLPVALVANMKANFDVTIAAASTMLMLFALVVMIVLDRLVGLDAVMGKGLYRN